MNFFELFVPSRVCLFGEHSDWAGGHRRTNSAIVSGVVIITGTNQGCAYGQIPVMMTFDGDRMGVG